MYVCMYACMHIYMDICMYVCMLVCMYLCMYVDVNVCMHICVYVHMCILKYVCMYVFMYACVWSIWSDVYSCFKFCIEWCTGELFLILWAPLSPCCCWLAHCNWEFSGRFTQAGSWRFSKVGPHRLTRSIWSDVYSCFWFSGHQ